jgi:hypothetical protein
VSVSTITTFGCYGNVLQMLRVWDLTSFTCVVTVPYAATVVVGAPRVVLLDFAGFAPPIRCVALFQACIPGTDTFLTGNSAGNLCKWALPTEAGAQPEKLDIAKLAGGAIGGLVLLRRHVFLSAVSGWVWVFCCLQHPSL